MHRLLLYEAYRVYLSVNTITVAAQRVSVTYGGPAYNGSTTTENENLFVTFLCACIHIWMLNSENLKQIEKNLFLLYFISFVMVLEYYFLIFVPFKQICVFLFYSRPREWLYKKSQCRIYDLYSEFWVNQCNGSQILFRIMWSIIILIRRWCQTSVKRCCLEEKAKTTVTAIKVVKAVLILLWRWSCCCMRRYQWCWSCDHYGYDHVLAIHTDLLLL